jgi:glutaredoxin/glutathione-dependent peroxiredoxin
MTLSIGDKIPDGTVYKLVDGQPRDYKVYDLLGGKKVILFGIPGAFTLICSTKQVPQYYAKLDEFKKLGIEGVFCTAVNDPFVMSKWAQDMSIDEDKLQFLADGDASWHEKMNLTQYLAPLGKRSLRYSMILNDLVIESINVEEEGGVCYAVSDPDRLLKELKDMS